jgi:1,4-alpha-glucan branching enzyme
LLRGAFHAADVFCLPSLHEPFGIVILEAWAAGLPVVASRVGGIPSFTNDGEDILHAEPGNPKHLARQLIELLERPDLAARLAAAGRGKARREYDWSIISERLLALYDDIAEGNRR